MNVGYGISTYSLIQKQADGIQNYIHLSNHHSFDKK